MSNLFTSPVTRHGTTLRRPLDFYVGSLREATRQRIAQSISRNGGQIVRHGPIGMESSTIELVEEDIVSVPTDHPVYSVQFVDYCLQRKECSTNLLQEFRLIPSWNAKLDADLRRIAAQNLDANEITATATFWSRMEKIGKLPQGRTAKMCAARMRDLHRNSVAVIPVPKHAISFTCFKKMTIMLRNKPELTVSLYYALKYTEGDIWKAMDLLVQTAKNGGGYIPEQFRSKQVESEDSMEIQEERPPSNAQSSHGFVDGSLDFIDMETMDMESWKAAWATLNNTDLSLPDLFKTLALGDLPSLYGKGRTVRAQSCSQNVKLCIREDGEIFSGEFVSIAHPDHRPSSNCDKDDDVQIISVSGPAFKNLNPVTVNGVGSHSSQITTSRATKKTKKKTSQKTRASIRRIVRALSSRCEVSERRAFLALREAGGNWKIALVNLNKSK